jgi:hypothetical protein
VQEENGNPRPFIGEQWIFVRLILAPFLRGALKQDETGIVLFI